MSARASLPLPVLATKLFAPRPPGTLVSRPRLTERLRAGAHGRLTVISAPAGSGKTTLLAEIAAPAAGAVTAATATAAAWVSLDAEDNNPALFWTCIIRALQKAHPGVGDACIGAAGVDAGPAVDDLAGLINDIAALNDDVTLILDDYHVIDAPEIYTSLTYFLDHMPQQMHVIIATRTDPLLPLARMRARGEMVELRGDDLRFQAGEAAEFLNQAMRLELPAADVAALEKRTEGWVAGLKLAGLSMKSQADRRRFIDAFSGNNRYIADYLVEEVLNSQPERTRRFLLATSILERMNGPLCEAVTQEVGSQEMLEELEARNLFVVALDDSRQWYRYHHLFAEVLVAHASREDVDQVREHHRRASEWHERDGSISGALRHARLAEDMERVASLLERHWPAMDRSYHTERWLALAKTLPDEIITARPALLMGYAWAVLNAGELEAAADQLDRMTTVLETHPDEGDVLRRQVATARIYLAQSHGDAAATVEHAQHLVAMVPSDDLTATSTARALLALAYWAAGALDDAHDTFNSALAAMRQDGDVLSAIRGVFVPGDIRAAQGRLDEAERTYNSGLALAAAHTAAGASETDELYVGLSAISLARNDIVKATELLQQVQHGATGAVHAGNRSRWCVAMARVAAAQGRLGEAADLLDEAERHDRRDPVPRVRPIPALRARVAIEQGALAEAEQWLLGCGVTCSDNLTFLDEYEHVTLARVLIARYRASGDRDALRDAAALLARLTEVALTGGRNMTAIETLILQAVVHDARGTTRSAVDALVAALAVAEPVGVIRPFVDEGHRVRELLRQPAIRAAHGAFARRILSSFAEAEKGAEVPVTAVGAVRPLQLLTKREIEILQLIAAGMRNEDIATHLFISPSTTKRHIANIYTKLDSHHRTEALNRAIELNLL